MSALRALEAPMTDEDLQAVVACHLDPATNKVPARGGGLGLGLFVCGFGGDGCEEGVGFRIELGSSSVSHPPRSFSPCLIFLVLLPSLLGGREFVFVQ